MRNSAHDRHRGERGSTLIELAIVVAVILIIATIAVARLSRAKGSSEGGAAVGTLRAIAAAQTTARYTYGSHLPAPDLADLGLLDSTFRVMPVERSGYKVTESGDGDSIAYHADPVGLEHGARRFFMRAADSRIHWTDSGDPADENSPPLGPDARE